MTGTYILVIYLEIDIELTVGALGSRKFKKGFYLYVGSAMGKIGSSTLLNRVKRHLRPFSEKKKHWHIDYLLENESAKIFQIFLIPSINRIECLISEELRDHCDGFIKNFGSSDCSCESHLYFFLNYDCIPFRV